MNFRTVPPQSVVKYVFQAQLMLSNINAYISSFAKKFQSGKSKQVMRYAEEHFSCASTTFPVRAHSEDAASVHVCACLYVSTLCVQTFCTMVQTQQSLQPE